MWRIRRCIDGCSEKRMLLRTISSGARSTTAFPSHAAPEFGAAATDRPAAGEARFQHHHFQGRMGANTPSTIRLVNWVWNAWAWAT